MIFDHLRHRARHAAANVRNHVEAIVTGVRESLSPSLVAAAGMDTSAGRS